MKTKELSKQVRDQVVEKYRSGLGYRKISKTLNVPRSTIKAFGQMEKIWKHNKPAKRGLPTKRTALIRQATKSSTGETGVSVHWRTLNRAGLYR